MNVQTGRKRSTNSRRIDNKSTSVGSRIILSMESILILGLSVILFSTVNNVVVAQSQHQPQQPLGPPVLGYAQRFQHFQDGSAFHDPQAGKGNNVLDYNDQTESIYNVPAPSGGDRQSGEDPLHENSDRAHEDDDFVYRPIAGDDLGLQDSAPPDYDHHLYTPHHDEAINTNLLPDDDHSTKLFTELSDSVIVGEKVLRLRESPYVLNTDLEVDQGGKLVVEPGVVVHVAPMVGITVRGTMIAVVSCLYFFGEKKLSC